MAKIKEYVFKKKTEKKLEEKKEIFIDKEEEKENKIIANLNNQELKSYYLKKLSNNHLISIFLMIVTFVFLANLVLSIFELGMFKLNFFSFFNLLNSYWSNLVSNFIVMCICIGSFGQESRKKEKYEKLLSELK
jgi:hypothetical protein